jgi:imidazolonepropionase-like amidohydrolase
LTDLTIVAAPGAAPVEGSILIRDGRIDVVGAAVNIPPDAAVHELPGRMAYAGLIEPYLRLKEEPTETGESGSGDSKPENEPREGDVHQNSSVRAEVRAAASLPLPEAVLEEMRESGYTVALVAPGQGVFRGQAVLVSLGDGDPKEQVIDPDHAQIFAFEHGDWESNEYPTSLMGSIALARQTLLDTGWHRDAWEAWARDQTAERPPENQSLAALLPVLEGKDQLFMESEDVFMLPRALALAREFSLKAVVVSGGSDEYRDLANVKRWLERAGAPLVLTLDFPLPPRWDNDEESVAIELEDLVHWERAPGNAAALWREGVEFSVTTQGLEKGEQVLANLRAAIRSGLSEGAALAALTTRPAALLGISDRAGTLEPGKAGNIVIATGPLFQDGTKIEEVWIDGRRYGEDPERASPKNVEGTWDLTLETKPTRTIRVKFKHEDGGVVSGKLVPQERQEKGATSKRDAEKRDVEAAPKAAEPSELPLEKVALSWGVLSFSLPQGAGEGDFTLRLDGKMLNGEMLEGGEEVRVLGRTAPEEDEEKPLELLSQGMDAWPPEASSSTRPAALHVRNAVLWTLGPEGTLENADLIALDGKITEIGRGLASPERAVVIDAAGKHVTPGLIDCHSHSSISGGVNEGTNSCTAEVRIGDVIDPHSPAMYRELAGGLTISNLLHGSANAIGGQNAVIKLKWGEPAENLLFVEAPHGIKFALGENVKQSNWGDDYTTRYPQTRMGVEQFIRDRFHAAEDYRKEWNEWQSTRSGIPPRRELQLETLLEILDGDRLVHCHSYRSDEIIMFLRVAEDFGFRIGTFQHVLEGYKCADEIAAHGAGASAFSDWWSYKYEVIDAIPYAGEIMWRRGVNVSFNSDSSELSRRLNLEAAKAAKYGDVPDDEALAFVTRNPAAQLGIDPWVGTLEAGKHADFVIWSQHPLSDMAVCEETWIEGVRRFSREDDSRRRPAALELREKLLAKAKQAWKADDPRLKEEEAETPASGEFARGAFGRRWGEGVERGEAHLHQGECELCGHSCGGL